jgi:hypothetical protein
VMKVLAGYIPWILITLIIIAAIIAGAIRRD